MKDHTQLTDPELWKLMQDGDKQALEVIYRKHYGILLNYGKRIYPNKEIVEDYIHDLFLNLYTKQIKVTVTEVSFYLVRALHNKLINHVQRQKENVEIDDIQFTFSLDEEIEIFRKSDEDILFYRRLSEAYKQLSDRQKHILYLRFVMKLNYNQIADMLNMGQASAINLVSRTIAKMRKLLLALLFLLFF